MATENTPDTDAAATGGKKEFPCGECGAKLTYLPGSSSIKCQYCGHENPIEETGDLEAAHEEQDFHQAIENLRDKAPMVTEKTVKCTACAAEFTWDDDVHADDCPFCGSPIVTDPKDSRHLQPQALIPFQLSEKEAQERLKKWLGSLWFAPNDVKKVAYTQGKLSGMYVPYWTYDSQTFSRYAGERGINYTEQYQTTDNEGKVQTRTRTRVDWTPVSGHVDRFFDDVLIVGSKSIPKKYADRLDEWKLGEIVPYNENYLAGYRSEVYQVDLEEGFTDAKSKMDRIIEGDVRRDIGGDQQRIHYVNTRYEDITFKHILLPVWMNAYRYNGKAYQFLVNGQTGEVEGARPYSWVKIGLAVLAAAVVIGAIVYFAN